jgi:hypothetical protein
MDEADIRLLAVRDRGEAIATARLHGFEQLAEELTADATRAKKRAHNVFFFIKKARLSVAEAGSVCNIPRSTAQAAAAGRIAGGLSKAERSRLYDYLLSRRDALDEAISVCERSLGL